MQTAGSLRGSAHARPGATQKAAGLGGLALRGHPRLTAFACSAPEHPSPCSSSERQQPSAHQECVPSTSESVVELAHSSPAAACQEGLLTQLSSAAAVTAACLAQSLVHPEVAAASGGSLTAASLEWFQRFLEQVEALGPWGGVAFVTVVMFAEMVPLFPTQPLSLASGLLFGGPKGAVLMLLGVTLAATNAFLIARGVGRPLAQRIINAELSHAREGGETGAVGKAMAQVEDAISSGGLWKQLTAITLLRLTPVVPFSASNYLLGLTPVQLPAFLGGTLLGMSVWSTVYASLGGASRVLLDGGEDLGTLISDLGNRAAEMSSSAASLTAVAAGVGVTAWVLYSKVANQSQQRAEAAASSNGTTVLGQREQQQSEEQQEGQQQAQKQQHSREYVGSRSKE